jgi:hypothetical protein
VVISGGPEEIYQEENRKALAKNTDAMTKNFGGCQINDHDQLRRHHQKYSMKI